MEKTVYPLPIQSFTQIEIFLRWGEGKGGISKNPQTIEELKTAITAKIRAIPKEEFVKVIDNFARRIQVCLQRNGGIWNLSWESHKLTKN